MAVKLCYHFCKSRSLYNLVFFGSRDSCEDGEKTLNCCAGKLSVSTINILVKWFFFYNQACTLMLILKSSVMMFHSYMKIFFIYEMGLKFFPSPVTSSNSLFICRPEFLRSLLRTTKSCTTKFSYDSKENLQTVVMITRFACG